MAFYITLSYCGVQLCKQSDIVTTCVQLLHIIGRFVIITQILGFGGKIWDILPGAANAAPDLFGSPDHVLQEKHLQQSPPLGEGMNTVIFWSIGIKSHRSRTIFAVIRLLLCLRKQRIKITG